jgi:hypothetical protein
MVRLGVCSGGGLGLVLPGVVFGRLWESFLAGFLIGWSGRPLLCRVALGRTRRRTVLPGVTRARSRGLLGALGRLLTNDRRYRLRRHRLLIPTGRPRRLLLGADGVLAALLGPGEPPRWDHRRSRRLTRLTLNRGFRVRLDLRGRVRRGRRPRPSGHLRILPPADLGALGSRLTPVLEVRSPWSQIRSTLDLDLWSTLALAGPVLFRRVGGGRVERFRMIWLEAPGTGGGVGRSVHACSLV